MKKERENKRGLYNEIMMSIIDLEYTMIRIKAILEGPEPNKNSAKFYDSDGKFRNKKVELLLQLVERIDNPEVKRKFWSLMGFPFLSPPLKSPMIGEPSSARRYYMRTRMAIYKNCDYGFFLYIKSKKQKEAVDGFYERLKNENKFKEIIQAKQIPESYVKLLSCIYSILRNEDMLLQSDSLLNCTENIAYRMHSLIVEIRKNETPFEDISHMNKLENLMNLVSSINSEIRTIRFERVEEELSPINLEINQDKKDLKKQIKKYNLPNALGESLDNIEKKLRESKTKFDYKSCIDHIRSFIESLLITIAKNVRLICEIPITEPLDKFVAARNYLKNKSVGFYSVKQDKLLEGIYAFLSDSGTHKLTSDKEYARLGINTAVESALFLFKRLEKYSAEKGNK
ncbi:MAG: hypothetical protein Q7J67_04720 [bacterium]|nr:hypothetical protein [bacterium]